MFKNISFLIFFLIAFNCFCKPEITWYKINLSPFYIKDGPFKNQGIGDKIQSFLESKLPEYRHKTIYSNFLRMSEDSKTVPLFATLLFRAGGGRDNYLLFSAPYSINLPPKLFFISEKKYKFNKYVLKNNIIDLDKVFNAPSIIISIPAGRYYSNEIKTVIDKYSKNKNIFINYNENYLESTLKMVEVNRVDCFIENEVILNYTMKFKDLNYDFDSFYIASPDLFVYNSISVSKSKDGELLIKKINSILEKNIHKDEYISLITSFGDSKYKAEYKKLFKIGISKYSK